MVVITAGRELWLFFRLNKSSVAGMNVVTQTQTGTDTVGCLHRTDDAATQS